MAGSRGLGAIYDRYLRKAPRQSRSRAAVEALLSAAIEMVSSEAEAPVEFSLQELARRANVAAGSLYDYFEDRRSVLAGLTAKVTEENVRRFEERFAETSELQLEEAVGRVVDLLFETYLGDARTPRAVLRLVYQLGMMGTLADMHATFAKTMARTLAARRDVDAYDIDVVAYTITNMSMGVIHTALWARPAPFAEDRLRRELARALVAYLRAPRGAREARDEQATV